MAEFPTDPMLSKMLIASEKYGCTSEALVVAAMLDVSGQVFYAPKDKRVHAEAARKAFTRGATGDHLALARVYDAWEQSGFSRDWCRDNFIQFRSLRRARDIRKQLERLCERVEIPLNHPIWDGTSVAKAICAGFFFHAARLEPGGGYKTLRQKHSVRIHPSSCLAPKPVKKESKEYESSSSSEEDRDGLPPPKFVLYHELVHTSEQFMRQVQEVDPKWLVDVAPHIYSAKMLEGDGDEKASKKHARSVAKALAVKSRSKEAKPPAR